MNFPFAFYFWCVLLAGDIPSEIPNEIYALMEKGEYRKAERMLQEAAPRKMDSRERKAFLWEAERLRRIRLDYSLSRSALLGQLRERIPGVREKELEEWQSEGRLDWRMIDGAPRFLYCTVSNLISRYPEIRRRNVSYGKEPLAKFLAKIVEAANDAALREMWYARARRFRIRMSLRVKADGVPRGTVVRCWLPLPQECPFQSKVRILSCSPEPSILAQATAPHRSVYFEQPSRVDIPTSFVLEYAFTSVPRYTVLDPSEITAFVPDDARLFTREEPPHIVFLPEFQSLLQTVVGSETNPYLVARYIYLWLSENMKYSFAREYSTIRNISDYCYKNRYGDCGQIALLFMTLCRMKGIPARWESGWMLYPEGVNLHDWCTIYLHPYGWIPVDPNMGVEAMNTWDTLTPGEREAVRDFYFGRMDPYRLAINSNQGDEFIPPKKHVRSDTVDFQRGEVETEKENIYYDRFLYNLEILSSEPIESTQ